MAITLGTSATAVDDTGTDTAPSATPNGSAGDILVACLAYGNTTITGVPAGWALERNEVHAGKNIAMYSKTHSGSEGAATWTLNAGADWALRIIPFVDAATPTVTATGTFWTYAADPQTSVSITTAVDNAAVLRICMNMNNKNTATWATSTKIGTDLYTSVATMSCAWLIQPTAGASGTETFTWAGSTEGATITLSVPPAAAGLSIPVAMHHYTEN